MKILVVGTKGQLALSLQERAALPIRFVGRPELDLLDATSIERAVSRHTPDVIVNAAAYTAVDQAEAEPELAERINAEAPAVLARSARAVGARLIHISTDYVFDGTGTEPYREEAPTAPQGVYGRTKLAGEEAVRAELAEHAIVRTAWVYSPFGRNFVKTMLGLAEARDQVQVVADQFGNPTSALDLADGLLAMVGAWRNEGSLGLGQTFHLVGSGSTNWAGFAREVFTLSAERGGATAEVVPIATVDWPAKAPRPLNSRLDSSKFREVFSYSPPMWQVSLSIVVDRLIGPP